MKNRGIASQSHSFRAAAFTSKRVQGRSTRFILERLEDRIAPATFLVTNALDGAGSGPKGSLRNAIAQADVSGGTVMISRGLQGPILLDAGELVISHAMTIINTTGSSLAIRQTTPGARVFHVTSDAGAGTVSITGASNQNALTITGGNLTTGNGGGILVDDAGITLRLSDVNVVGNYAGLVSAPSTAQNGGGVYASGPVVLQNSSVGSASVPNQTSGDGAGLWAGSGVALIGASVVANAAGTDGGGLYVASGDVTIARQSAVSNNIAPNGTAGGLYVVNGAVSVSQSQVDGNSAKDVGGINIQKGSVQVVNASEVNRNSSTAILNASAGDFGGGAIYLGTGDVLISSSQVSFNHSVGMYSSGIVVGLGNVTVSAHGQVDWNSANGPGGGIAANFGGTVTVSGGSQVDDNTGSGLGGGIVNFSSSMQGVVIEGRSEVSGNTLTNYETIGQVLAAFLAVIPNATSSAAPDTLSAIQSLEQDFASASGQTTGAPGLASVAGGGIATPLGAAITISGGSDVDNNITGAPVTTANGNVVGLGGGLFAFRGTISVQNSAVDGNTAFGDGGGIWNGRTLTVVGSTIANNAALLSRGGGLYNARGAGASIVQTTLSANSAGFGGGAYNRGSLTFTDSQVTRNQALHSGGGILNLGQLIRVRTSIIGNTPDNIASSD